MPAEAVLSRSSDSLLTLVTLGSWGLSASPNATSTLQFGPSKPLALLVYLALSPGSAAAREHLLDLLWADLEPTAANHAYRQTVWYIRQRLGETCLRAGGNQLTLVAPTQTDRDAFLAAVGSQEWERAIALYTGDFLPGFAAPGGAEFERWADLERWRLRSLFNRAGEALARRHLAGGRAREAVVLARRVRDTDRAGEAGWRLLLEALMAAGDPVGAAVEADQLEEMLREDGREPEPATRTLLRLARKESRESAESPNQRGLVAELVGREGEFGAIIAAWEAVRRGAPRHVHVTGAAGLGKSRLLADAQTRLRSTGASTALVRAAPGERSLSYALAADLATALAAQRGSAAVSSATAGTLVGLAPSLAGRYPTAEFDRSIGDELMRRRVLAVAELLASVADEAPLALLLDDLHWMDMQSRQLVAALLGRLGRSPVLVVTTARPSQEGAIENADTEQLTLEPLSVPQVAALVASFGNLPDAAWATTLPEKLRAAAKGSPLIVLETLELALERGILDLDAAAWSCPAPDDLDGLLAQGAALRQRLERLTREQRWLLLLLAVHGTAISLDEIRAITQRPEDATQVDLALLEARAMATRERGDWQPAHDAIAELAIELAPPEALQAAHAALGKAMAANTSAPDLLPRAAQHFAAAGDKEALNSIFQRWLRASRSRGDQRTVKALAQELLGHTANGRAEALVRALPLRYRIGLVTPARIGVLTVMVVIGAMGVAAHMMTRDDPVIRVVGLVPDGDGVRPVQVQVGERDLLDQRTIDMSRARPVPDLPGHIPRPIGLTYLGNGMWTWVAVTGQPNGEEPVVLTRHGEVKVPPAPGDDAVGSASPDGRFLAVNTDRWSRSNAGHVGIFDVQEDTLRQVTSGPDRDLVGPWSLDGTRIAFERLPYDLRPPALCWVTFDGHGVTCFTPEGWNLDRIVSGWISTNEILALGIDSTGQSAVYSVNLDTRKSTWQFAANYAFGLAGSPWVLCLCEVRAAGASELQLRRTDVPGRLVHLTGMASLEHSPTLALVPDRPAQNLYLDRLVIAGPPDGTVAPGVPTSYKANGFATDGSGIDVPVLDWAVADSSVAAIDSQGVLMGRHTGRTTVYASAGGWRRDSVRVRVEARPVNSALSEAWNATWEIRWRPYGQPLPKVIETREGRGLFVAGDSSYYSGVYSRAAFTAVGGLGVRMIVRTPVAAVKWQVLHVSLVPLADSLALRQWDHRTATLPLNADDMSRECGVNYPTGEALWGKRFIGMTAARVALHVPVDTTIASGKTWELTLQLLPDGRCAVAINGKALRISGVSQTTDQPRHVVIDGQSVRTRILVDHLEVWRGVPDSIDWSRVDSSRVRR